MKDLGSKMISAINPTASSEKHLQPCSVCPDHMPELEGTVYGR